MNQYIAAIHGGVSALMLTIVGYIFSLFKLIPLKDFGILILYTSKCCFFFMKFKSLAGKNKTQLDFSPLMSISLYLLIALFIFIIFPKTFFKQKQLADKHQESIKKLTNKNKNEKSNTKKKFKFK